MAPVTQSTSRLELPICPNCRRGFNNSTCLPVNQTCGHTVCSSCLRSNHVACANDNVPFSAHRLDFPVNTALLLLLKYNISSFETLYHKFSCKNFAEDVRVAEECILFITNYLSVVKTDKGHAYCSSSISPALQRKAVSLMCCGLYEEEGRRLALKVIRSFCERIANELLNAIQSGVHQTNDLWAAVRERGCQFLGPAVQDDVLRIIMSLMKNGDEFVRKQLVERIRNEVATTYPQVSNTGVGHVVQILYRGSCFNVIKRENQSSLMVLKEELRSHSRLRREHDSQLIQIAMEAGLRISPEQWSSLLHGDYKHRSEMQSVIDSIQQSLPDLLAALNKSVIRNTNTMILMPVVNNFNIIANHDPAFDATWRTLSHHLNFICEALRALITYVKESKEKPTDMRFNKLKPKVVEKQAPVYTRYKTKMCREVVMQKACPRGLTCTYAHNVDELRKPIKDSMTFCDGESEVVMNNRPIGDTPTKLTPLMAVPDMMSAVALHPEPVIVAPVKAIVPTEVFVSPDHYPAFVMPPAEEMIIQAPRVPPIRPTVLQAVPAYRMPAPAFIPHPIAHPGISPLIWSNVSYPVLEPSAHLVPSPKPAPFSEHTAPNSNSFVLQNVIFDDADPFFLLSRRNAILERLSTDNNDLEESHVSYTVANSVLHDDIDKSLLELPPLSLSDFSRVPKTLSTTVLQNLPFTATITNHEHTTAASKTRLLSSVPTASPAPLVRTDSTKPATVQADCSIMNVRDVIQHSLVAPSIQRNSFGPQASWDMVDPVQLTSQLPKMMKPGPITPSDPQDCVALSLDHILTVQDKLVGNPLTSAEKVQLCVELNIAERQLNTLDRQTQQNCLLKELKAVDRKIEGLSGSFENLFLK